MLYTDLPGNTIALVHVNGIIDLLWNTMKATSNIYPLYLALLLRDLGTLLVSDNVADLPGHVAHHSLLECVTVLHSVHHRHLDCVADSLGHVGALLVVHGVSLGPGHHFLLSLVLSVADIFLVSHTGTVSS